MAGYIIFNYKILDRGRIDELTQLSLPVNEKYGAEVIVGSPVKTIEGSTLSHIVILKFSSFEAAETYYSSAEHKALSTLRNEITEGWSAIVPGDSETGKIVASGYFEES